jgi:hypothetical protein
MGGALALDQGGMAAAGLDGAMDVVRRPTDHVCCLTAVCLAIAH